MTSIVKKSYTDMILDLTNYINTAKDTNALKGNEFAKVIELFGDVAANQAKRGLLTEDEREQIETLLPTDERYFNHPHKDIGRSRKMALESIDMGLEEANRRTMMASPVSYSLRK